MTESDIMRSIQIAASAHGWRLFRNNVGMAWTLNPLTKKLRRIKFGLCTGSADLIGWTQNGKFVAIEVKTETGRPTSAQVRFIKAARSAQCIGIIARSVSDVFPA